MIFSLFVISPPEGGRGQLKFSTFSAAAGKPGENLPGLDTPDDATGIPFEISEVYISGPCESRKDGPLSAKPEHVIYCDILR
jgi:hypothetical protein